MLTTMTSKLSKTLFLPSVLAVFCLSLWLVDVSPVHGQPPRPGQNQQNPAQAGTDRAKEEPISGWYIAGIAAFFGLSNRMANVTAMRPNAEFYTMGRS